MIDELNALAGAYALDALTEDDRHTFESHLETCGDCADEVIGLQFAAAELSHLYATPPPPELRDALLNTIGRVRPLAPTGSNVIPMHRARRAGWATQLVAAACALFAVLAGGWGWQQHEHARTAVASAIVPTDTRSVTGNVGQAGTATVIYSKSTGSFVMKVHGAASLAADKTYQAWLISPSGQPTSVGTFTPDAQGNVTEQVKGDLADAALLGITVEPSGGSAVPTGKPTTVSL